MKTQFLRTLQKETRANDQRREKQPKEPSLSCCFGSHLLAVQNASIWASATAKMAHISERPLSNGWDERANSCHSPLPTSSTSAQLIGSHWVHGGRVSSCYASGADLREWTVEERPERWAF